MNTRYYLQPIKRKKVDDKKAKNVFTLVFLIKVVHADSLLGEIHKFLFIRHYITVSKNAYW